MKTVNVDLVIVGSGFAGAITALLARRNGLSVLVIERGRHPRFVIGESSTPLTNLLLEELADDFDLPFLKSLAKWGSWQREFPELKCGLKRGFSFFHHHPGRDFEWRDDHADQMLVAASPNDAVADTHWYRRDFDAFLVGRARELGAKVWEETTIVSFAETGDGVRLKVTNNAGEHAVSARFLIDASGPRGFLHRALRLGERPFPGLPSRRAIYNHFDGVGSFVPAGRSEGAPYPPESAAVHHVFDGGWIWVLPFNDGTVSAGVVLTDERAAEWNVSSGPAGWSRVLEQFPSVKRPFASATPVETWGGIREVAFRSNRVVGRRWAMLPSAAGFVDPLLSTGFPLALLGVQRLAAVLPGLVNDEDNASALHDYGQRLFSDLDVTAALVAALYSSASDFGRYTDLLKLYFAAMSHTETVRRLGRRREVDAFLLSDRAEFRMGLAEVFQHVDENRTDPDARIELAAMVRRVIEPVDVAGLNRTDRHNWYPVDLDALFASRHKLGATGHNSDALERELRQMLRRCGIAESRRDGSPFGFIERANDAVRP